MTNKKKANVGKMNNKRVNNKKEVKSKVLTEEEIKEHNKKTIKELVIITIVIAIVFGVIYLLTIGAEKLGWFDIHYTKPITEEATISYENIQVGTILNREGLNYYVVLADMSKDSMHIQTLINNYKNKENAKLLYVVDLSEGLNKSVVSDTNNLLVQDIKDLKVKDTSLVEIRSNKIVNVFIGLEKIEDILK